MSVFSFLLAVLGETNDFPMGAKQEKGGKKTTTAVVALLTAACI